MPAPAHLRITYSGVFGSVAAPAEIWSFGLSCGTGNTTEPDPFLIKADLALKLQQLEDAYLDLIAGIDSTTILTRTRLASVNSSGKTPREPSGAYIQADKTSAIAGLATKTMPPQIALTTSLESNFAGPSGRGRYYLPGPLTGSIEAAGTITEAARDAHASRALSFLNKVNTAMTNGVGQPAYGRLVIASGGSATKGLLPALYPVVRVGVGRALDTMRSRRGELLEAKEFSVLA